MICSHSTPCHPVATALLPLPPVAHHPPLRHRTGSSGWRRSRSIGPRRLSALSPAYTSSPCLRSMGHTCARPRPRAVARTCSHINSSQKPWGGCCPVVLSACLRVCVVRLRSTCTWGKATTASSQTLEWPSPLHAAPSLRCRNLPEIPPPFCCIVRAPWPSYICRAAAGGVCRSRVCSP